MLSSLRTSLNYLDTMLKEDRHYVQCLSRFKAPVDLSKECGDVDSPLSVKRLRVDDKISDDNTHLSKRSKTESEASRNSYLDKVKGKFFCQERANEDTASSEPPPADNQHIIKWLEILSLFKSPGEAGEWKKKNYNRAINFISKQPFRIDSEEALQKLLDLPSKGIFSKSNTKMVNRLREIIDTGSLAEAIEIQRNPMNKALIDLSKIHGVGFKTAHDFLHAGLSSVQDLRDESLLKARGVVLTASQAIGVKYYEDFQQRMPRSEVEEIERVVVKALGEVSGLCTAAAVGSYRRGKGDCGDVDILIMRPPSSLRRDPRSLMVPLLDKLTASGFLTDTLSVSHYGHDLPDEYEAPSSIGDETCGSSATRDGAVPPVDCRESFMGVCRVEGHKLFRRLDIKVYPSHMFAFAMLYFTGNDHFNRSMRNFARRKGFSLSDTALIKVTRLTRDTKVEHYEIPCASEEDVFAALGLDYVKPQRRMAEDCVKELA